MFHNKHSLYLFFISNLKNNFILIKFIAPVVITSETHQGPANVYSQQANVTSFVPGQIPQMPYPTDNVPPYPQAMPPVQP